MTDRFDHLILLGSRHLGKNRQRKNAALVPPGIGKIPRHMAESLVGRQERQGNGIIDHGLDTSRREMGGQIIAPVVARQRDN